MCLQLRLYTIRAQNTSAIIAKICMHILCFFAIDFYAQKVYTIKEGDNMSKFHLRIRELRNSRKLSQQELADYLRISKSSINMYERGEREPSLDTLEAIADFFNVNMDYLTGKNDNPQYYEEGTSALSEFPNIKPIRLKKFPMLGEIACGKPIFAQEEKKAYIMADMNIDADFCLTAKGDSMINARIHNGDIVFIRQAEMVENGEIAAVIIDNEATLKRVYYYPEKNKLMLTPENPAFEPFVYVGEELDDIRILGKAVYFMSAVK